MVNPTQTVDKLFDCVINLRPILSSYRNQLIDVHLKLVDWFLHDKNIVPKWINSKRHLLE